MVATVPTQSIDTYLAMEEQAETRHEYRNGEIVEMPGGTPNHSKIAVRWHALLWFALRGKPYELFGSDLRLWIPKRNAYTYPDAMVVRCPIQLQEGRKDAVVNPILIAEVLSESTRDYDRAEKFATYRTISALQEYILIDQYAPHVEQYVRQSDRRWLFAEYEGMTATVCLESLKLDIALADLYEGVVF